MVSKFYEWSVYVTHAMNSLFALHACLMICMLYCVVICMLYSFDQRYVCSTGFMNDTNIFNLNKISLTLYH